MKDAFAQRFGDAAAVRIFRAPGRVNLIGEHTDYNLGFVMPMALEMATWIAAAPNREGKLRICSEHAGETREWPIAQVGTLKPQKHWTDYCIGVAQQLIAAGYTIQPLDLLIRSTVPEGSGLSSSAALEVSTALALLHGREIEKLELAKLCQRAEREFVGVPCGIMDQYISVFGREGAAVEIDCRSLGHRAAQLPARYLFLAVNSMVKHALGDSAYKARVQECAAAVATIASRYPEVKSLRDVTPELFAQVESALHPIPAKRARHIVTEDDRVETFVKASAAGDAQTMGRLMVESHRSLQHDYEVSCDELDFLVDTALGIQGVMGSRMTGGGFGGCTVTMLRSEGESAFREAILRAYHDRFGIEARVYPCVPSAGAAEEK